MTPLRFQEVVTIRGLAEDEGAEGCRDPPDRNEQGTGSPTGGEDTTEIPRSTTQVSMQLTMERMRRAAPAGKLNKAPGQGEECSKSENTFNREMFALVSFSDQLGKFKLRSISLEV